MNIISRTEWGARRPNGDGPAPLPAEFLYLHNSATGVTAGPRDLENIGHSRFKKGISYTFVVTVDGLVYEGHSIDRRGTHTAKLNSKARAICAVGNFDKIDPPDRLLAAIVDLTVHGHKNGWWPNQITGGHRDAPGAHTACPGGRLYKRIPDLNRLIAARLAAPSEDDMFDQPDKDKLNATHWLATQANDRVGRIEALLKEQTRLLEAIAEKHGVD